MKKQKILPITLDEIMLHEDFIRFIENNGNDPHNPWENEFENNPDLKKEFERAVQLHKLLSSHKINKYPEDYKNKQISRLLWTLVLSRKKTYFQWFLRAKQLTA